MNYTEKQTGWLVISVLLVPIIFIPIAFYFQWGDEPISQNEYLITASLFSIILLLFFQMKTTVDNEKIKISYGIGLISKTILLTSIEQVEIVRTKWYNGIGIRMLRNGWLYNIQSLDAVELKLNSSTSIIRIGTLDNNKLKVAIDSKKGFNY